MGGSPAREPASPPQRSGRWKAPPSETQRLSASVIGSGLPSARGRQVCAETDSAARRCSSALVSGGCFVVTVFISLDLPDGELMASAVACWPCEVEGAPAPAAGA